MDDGRATIRDVQEHVLLEMKHTIEAMAYNIERAIDNIQNDIQESECRIKTYVLFLFFLSQIVNVISPFVINYFLG